MTTILQPLFASWSGVMAVAIHHNCPQAIPLEMSLSFSYPIDKLPAQGLGTGTRKEIMQDTIVSPTTSYEQYKRLYHQELGRRSSLGMAEKVRQGGLAGQPPLGYIKGYNGDTVLDSQTALIIKKCFEEIVKPKASLRKVLALAHEQGLESYRGKPLCASSLQRILRNAFYAGMIRYKGELYRGKHQPLISKSLFERVQTKLRQRRCS